MKTRTTAARVAAIFILLVCFSGCAKYRAQKLGIEPPAYRVRVERNVMVPMSDGARMATDIYFPAGAAKAPAILVRTPYGKGQQFILGRNNLARIMAQRGYVFIVQDARGRYGSDGAFYPFINDGQDGRETIAWIKQQPWSNGRVGTYGASYLGTTQWFEAPGQDIEAMHLAVTSPNLKEVLYTDGELHLMTVYFWSVVMGERKANLGIAGKIGRLEKLMQTLPLSSADDRAGRDVDYFNDALDPKRIWDIYGQVNFDAKYAEVSAPAVFVAGWYDMFLGPQLDDFNRLIREGRGDAAKSALIVGPWGHGANADGGIVDFGEAAKMEKALGPAHALAWYDRWLKDKDTEAASWPRVKIFVMGDNVWRDENEWPLARTQYTKYYLHSQGAANTSAGDGVLTTDPPQAEPHDAYTYDPLDPVMTRGGNNLGLNLGVKDQATIEDREDVLCYTTPALARDVEVTGPISAALYAASDARDTDFTVKLVDLYPDGKAVNIQDGVVRALYRNNDPDQPTPLVPGAIEEYQVDLWATSNTFKAGHRLRVEVSSSNFPRFNRSLNTGEPATDAERTVPARQTIFHDADHPSHVLLPVIPRD